MAECPVSSCFEISRNRRYQKAFAVQCQNLMERDMLEMKEYFPQICQINFWHIGRVCQLERKERLKYENQF